MVGDLAYKLDCVVRERLDMQKSRQTLYELRHSTPGELTEDQATALTTFEAEVKASGWQLAELTSLQQELKLNIFRCARLWDAHCSDEERSATTAQDLKQIAHMIFADVQLRQEVMDFVDLVVLLDPNNKPLV